MINNPLNMDIYRQVTTKLDELRVTHHPSLSVAISDICLILLSELLPWIQTKQNQLPEQRLRGQQAEPGIGHAFGSDGAVGSDYMIVMI